MNKFSSAPWKSAFAFDRTYIRNIKDAQGEIIAQVCDLDDGVANDYLYEAIANAQLMAAAPDLLAALQYFLDALADDCEIDMCRITNEMESRARAAIARATGDQTVSV
jgi:hypothetical protein